jgi:hypothetical protein
VSDADATPDLARKVKHVTYKFPLSFVIVDPAGTGAPDLATLAKYAAAISRSMLGDFAPEYQMTAIVRADTSISPGEVMCGLFEHADQPGALGYHDWPPIIKVFPPLDRQDGAELSQTIDHEIKEATADLTIDQSRTGKDGHFWADEPCDAVEQDQYEIDGVKLSNFVLPGWYSGNGGKYDFLGKLSAPLSLTPGGYAQYFDPAKGWQQVTHAELAPRPYRLSPHGRSNRRRGGVVVTCPHT